MRLSRLATGGLVTAIGVAVLTSIVGPGSAIAGAGQPAGARPADPAGRAMATQSTLQTVPFEVSGELPIYPKALWSNGDSATTVRNLEARLAQLKLLDARYVNEDYGTATRGAIRDFQRSHGIPPLGYVDRNTWAKVTTATRQPTRAELFPPRPAVPGGALDPRCSTGTVLCIDKTSRQLRYVVDGAVEMSVDVRFGARATQTREGQFSVGWKSRKHHSKLFDSDMPFAMFFSGGQAVHYSSDFAARGYNGASHGCVNVRDHDGIKRLFGQVNVGDKVVVYRS